MLHKAYGGVTPLICWYAGISGHLLVSGVDNAGVGVGDGWGWRPSPPELVNTIWPVRLHPMTVSAAGGCLEKARHAAQLIDKKHVRPCWQVSEACA